MRFSSLSSVELDARHRIRNAVEYIDGLNGWTPDLLIKMVPDIDLVFFGGCLLGNVLVEWANGAYFAEHGGLGVLGLTWPSARGDGRAGQCRVFLNADGILLDHKAPFSFHPFKAAWVCLVHELVVS